MVYLIIVVLTIAVLYLLVRLLSLKKALKGAGKQLKEINRELEENRIVKLAVPDKDAEELLMVMNESLQAHFTPKPLCLQQWRTGSLQTGQRAFSPFDWSKTTVL